ncbi:RlpA-like double-psi beta-barrel-protein domain-containing protein-containing protein [Russula vinacea]|nr:RlpA-like double-psi beta-barrel-protein domain-containing protein-containing protein [Russula vinacea]
MYKLTLVPFAFFSLVLPILAIPSPVPDGFHGLEKRTAGSATLFHPGNGKCGGTNGDNDVVVAISSQIFDNGAHCGKQVHVSYNGHSVDATVVDQFPGGPNDLELSPAVFTNLALSSDNQIEIDWNFD